MARRFSTGYELNRVGALEEADGTPGGGGVTSTGHRTGNYGQRSNPTAGIKFFEWYWDDADVSEGYFRIYVKVATLPSANTAIFRVVNNAGTTQFDVRLTTTGTLQARGQGGSNIGSASSAINDGNYHRLECRIYDESAANGTCEVRLDGTAFASQSNTTPDIDAFRKIQIGIIDSTTADVYMDDVAMNDNSGSFQNSWPGPGAIIHIYPNSSGDNAQWTPSAGSNYQNVDETPSFNDITDYNSSNTLNQIDDYNLAAAPAAIGSSDNINVVQVGVRHSGAGASANASFVLRIKASSGGTVEESAAITPPSTTWVTNATDNTLNYLLTLYDLPGASTTPWTKSDLDNAQIGVRLSTASTNAARVTSLWLLVDFSPATSALKKLSGVAKDSIKKIDGVAIASVKKVMGVTV